MKEPLVIEVKELMLNCTKNATIEQSLIMESEKMMEFLVTGSGISKATTQFHKRINIEMENFLYRSGRRDCFLDIVSDCNKVLNQ
jgi:hypothetical protein